MHSNPNHNAPDMRNLIIAVVLSTAILLGWQTFVEEPKLEQARAEQERLQKEAQKNAPQPAIDSAQVEALTNTALPREHRLLEDKRVKINTQRLHGSVNMKGMRIDDITLANYHESVEKDEEVVLLSPGGGKDSYFAEFGWLPSEKGTKVPTATTQWNAKESSVGVNAPLSAEWNNGAGLKFEQQVAVDKDYMFTITQRVTNSSGKPVTLFPYGLVSRTYHDKGDQFYILHEGPLGVFDSELNELSYEDIRDDGSTQFKNTQGWLGITDKYWLAALVPDQTGRFTGNISYTNHQNHDKYQVDYLGGAITIAPGETQSVTQHFFAGAKEVKLLDQYMAALDIPLFDRAVDFGMLYFLTKPIFHALDYFNDLLGNFGLAIMLLTVCIKLLLFPLANKSYRSMSQLKVLMPKIEEIRKRYEDDRMRMNQEIMEFYKREKVNPASGCLPMLLQLPVFFALYKVLFVTIEMRHADFYGWITDLSAADPTNVFNAFGLIPWDPPGFLHIGVWPLIMCLTMVIQQRLNPKPTDPMQAQIMAWLPFIFLFLFASFPAGLVIYWAWNNLLSILQQWVITRETRAQEKAKRHSTA